MLGDDYADTPLKLGGPSAGTSGPQPSPKPLTSHIHDSPYKTQYHVLNEGATADPSRASQQQAVRPKLTGQSTRFTGPQPQYHTPDPQPTASPLTPQLFLPPPILTPYDHLTTPPHASTRQRSGASRQALIPCFDIGSSTGGDIGPAMQPSYQANSADDSLLNATPMPQPAMQTTTAPAHPPRASVHSPPGPIFSTMQPAQQPAMNPPAASHYLAPAVGLGPQVYNGYVYSTSAPQVPVLGFQTPQTINNMNNPYAIGPNPQLHMSQAETAVHYPQDWVHGRATPMLPSATFDHTDPPNTPAPVHPQTPTPEPQVSRYGNALPQPPPMPPFSTSHMHSHPSQLPLKTPARAITNPNLPLTAYGGFVQTHQVKNVQVFTGSADSRMLVEDWVRDMQYLLEAIELPTHLRFSTVVRHLSGEARRLILNLPSHEQTPERAFEELRAEYSDTQGSLDPLADFYECSQRPGESPCSYAIALEASLRAVEENQRGGRPFPDRDSKLTRQFLRGLSDEEVYSRISPMKPRLLSFRELQAELRNLAKEAKRFQSHHKVKKTYNQVHVTSECATNVKAERTKHPPEWSELTEMVKKLALCQEEQIAKLSRLESRIAAPPSIPPPRGAQQPSGTTVQGATVICYRCGKPGHIARVCRAVLSELHQTWAGPLQPGTPAEGGAPHSPRPLNS